jgi:hypothetical protein
MAREIEAQFDTAADALPRGLDVSWTERRPGMRMGILTRGDRQQPFCLFLRSVDGYPLVRCVSPIGTRDDGPTPSDLSQGFTARGARISVVYNQARLAYEFAVEGDVLLWANSNAVERVERLVKAVTHSADDLEARLLETDPTPSDVGNDLSEEPGYAR